MPGAQVTRKIHITILRTPYFRSFCLLLRHFIWRYAMNPPGPGVCMHVQHHVYRCVCGNHWLPSGSWALPFRFRFEHFLPHCLVMTVSGVEICNPGAATPEPDRPSDKPKTKRQRQYIIFKTYLLPCATPYYGCVMAKRHNIPFRLFGSVVS